MSKIGCAILIFIIICFLTSCTREVVIPVPDTASSDTDVTVSEAATPTPELPYTDIVISEVMPSNSAFLRDAGGEFSDWIELHNAGTESVNLSDFYLSDDTENPMKWQMPDCEIAADGYIVIYASGKDAEGEYNAPFKLSKEGETLTVSYKDGTVNSVFTYTGAEKNISITKDGIRTRFATPGFSNDDAGYLAYQNTLSVGEGLVISEVMNSNSKYIPHDGTYSDWVELYNNSDKEINLADYCLSDDDKDLTRAKLPSVKLAPHAYICIYCEDTDSHYKSYVTGFTLGSDEELYLSDAEGIVDFIYVADIPYGMSYGINGTGYAFFSRPTPNSLNQNGVSMITRTPDTSVAQGVYDDTDGLLVELSGEGDIHYTTDGSEPTVHSPLYREPFTVTKTVVIRARAYADGKIDSRIMTRSYIVNEHHTLPVLSLATDKDNLYSPETGIYVEGNHNNLTQDWERSASLALFEDGKVMFCEDCGLQLFGAGSRIDCEKKSLRVNFKTRYGTSKLKCDVFSDGVTGYKSLVMRAGEDAEYTIFRNEVFTTIAKKTNLLVQNNKYCILYVDGEYFGIFCLCERFSKTYYAQHHNIDENLVSVYEAPTSSDTAMGKLMRYAQSHDMSTAENYAYMDKHLDLTGMIDWFIMQAYTHNRDLGGNIRYFYRADKDYVEYAFYDLDWAFYKRDSRFDILNNGDQYSIIIHAMMKNPVFRERFIKRCGELLSGILRDDKVLAVITSYEEQIAPEIERERAKWRGNDPLEKKTPESWRRAVDRMKKYVTSSSIKDEMIGSLRSEIGLTDEEERIIRGG